MHFHSVYLVAAVASAVCAAPTNSFFNNVYDFTPELEEFYSRVSDYIKNGNFGKDVSQVCDASNVSLPAQASGLPSPTGILKYVAIGRGTQNYTCSEPTKDTTPTQIGALATLYDASCIVANYPDLVDSATKIVLNYDLPTDNAATLPPVNVELLGHHYFEDATTPVFNLDTTAQDQFGIAISKKNASMVAPPGSVSGQNNSGDGAVPWLYLTTIAGTVGNFTSVYRVNTAGGAAPATCEGQAASFQIQYSAQYFFYVSE
ncbi:hypothetical protein PISL3812_06460 [Talaromyces islandicus]|uniref:Malate dehydrogenase n=1 Tax=Talaromyces islandicus TaxID=28573 RepID=A0A0U1M1N5_TALIS|nr:hypothetical protein PISL3812_06460 [Talaromyces islandicus]